jgi:hypothetical protein
MKPSKKIERRLNVRLRDYEQNIKGSNKHETKVAQRIESGGFTQPGSRKKT